MNRYCMIHGGLNENECIAVTTPDKRGGTIKRLLCPFCGVETYKEDRCVCGRLKPSEQEYCTNCYEEVETVIRDELHQLIAYRHMRIGDALNIVSEVLNNVEDRNERNTR